ncbi:MAG: STAS/SEC14 domain-containing protein [Thermoanaerobaculia bacterium]
MRELPENVVAISASGRVTGEDYTAVLVPAVEKALARRERIRFLYLLGPAFEGFTASALWDDAAVGFGHRKAFERIAVVTDVPWVADAMTLFAFLAPCPVRVFGTTDLTEAKTWVSA